MPSDKDNKEQRDLYLYWMSWIKRAKKNHPDKAWKRAEDALLVSDENKDRPYVSGFRLLYERMKSYLDQISPTFDVVASQAFFKDEFVMKAAQCDKRYLDYLWSEQKIQEKQSQKLDSTIIRNCGYTLCGFDTKKWMPKLSYLKPSKVYRDPDCDGVQENEKAIAYEEDISVEEFVSKYGTKNIESILKKTGNILTAEEQQGLPDDTDPKMFKTIKIYHIFAKGSAAVRKNDSEIDVPKEKDVDVLLEKEVKRYLQYTEGHIEPLFDGEWPYELDDNEFPITALSFNVVSDYQYSYTDNDHMNKSDVLKNDILKDLEGNAYFTGNKKFGGTPAAADLTKNDIEKFLNDPQAYYFPNMIDQNGKPKILQIDTGRFELGLIRSYEIFDKVNKDSSALGELLSTSAQEFKDVTAMAVRVNEANAHQQVNRRLSGPYGFEESIKEDAIKLLEIAHQYVPAQSIVEVDSDDIDDFGNVVPKKEMIRLPWPEALQAISKGGKLIQLGVDAIVGQELAQFWREGLPTLEFKLSTTVRVKKGSTRETTQESRAAVMKQFYLEVLLPLYQATNRWDLAANYVKQMGQMANIDYIEENIPTPEDAQNVMAKQEEAEQIQKEGAIQEIQEGQSANIPV